MVCRGEEGGWDVKKKEKSPASSCFFHKLSLNCFNNEYVLVTSILTDQVILILQLKLKPLKAVGKRPTH